MKEIKAFIRPRRLQSVFKALKKEGFCCMTITDCEGTGNYSDPERDYPSLTYPFLHSKMAKLEMVIAADQEEKVVRVIRETGRTGDRGDGLIWVSEVNRVLRIRNEEEGSCVL